MTFRGDQHCAGRGGGGRRRHPLCAAFALRRQQSQAPVGVNTRSRGGLASGDPRPAWDLGRSRPAAQNPGGSGHSAALRTCRVPGGTGLPAWSRGAVSAAGTAACPPGDPAPSEPLPPADKHTPRRPQGTAAALSTPCLHPRPEERERHRGKMAVWTPPLRTPRPRTPASGAAETRVPVLEPPGLGTRSRLP